MINIHLIRHAHTVWSETGRYAGISDVPLSVIGLEKSLHLRDWAVEKRITHIYTSELIRAIETALPSSSALQIPIIKDSDLNEINYGDCEGLSVDQILSRFRDEWNTFRTFPSWASLPNGETGLDVVNRSRRAIARIIKDLNPHESPEIMVISHGTLIRLLIASLLDIPLDKFRSYFPELDHLSVSSLILNNNRLDDVSTEVGLLCLNLNIC